MVKFENSEFWFNSEYSRLDIVETLFLSAIHKKTRYEWKTVISNDSDILKKDPKQPMNVPLSVSSLYTIFNLYSEQKLDENIIIGLPNTYKSIDKTSALVIIIKFIVRAPPISDIINEKFIFLESENISFENRIEDILNSINCEHYEKFKEITGKIRMVQDQLQLLNNHEHTDELKREITEFKKENIELGKEVAELKKENLKLEDILREFEINLSFVSRRIEDLHKKNKEANNIIQAVNVF